jgi:hypothetical protein
MPLGVMVRHRKIISIISKGRFVSGMTVLSLWVIFGDNVAMRDFLPREVRQRVREARCGRFGPSLES